MYKVLVVVALACAIASTFMDEVFYALVAAVYCGWALNQIINGRPGGSELAGE